MSDLTERLRRQVNVTRMGTAQETITDCSLLMAAADALAAAEARLAAIDALHQPGDVEDYWTESSDPYCLECDIAWPCPTHRILHPEAGPTHE